MRSNYKRLGQYIQPVNKRNKNLITDDLQGLSMTKEFRKSTSNIVGTDLSKYKLVHKNQFACDFMSVIRVHKLPVVLHSLEEPVIVSPAYTVFEVIDENTLNPEYLMMWFRRSEFDRYADFRCDSAIRGGFKWDELCEVELPIPSIEKQNEIVKEYNTVVNRIKLNEQFNQKLEETAQALYKHWFVDFNFPNTEGKPYKSSGGAMVYNEELDKEIPVGWDVDMLSNRCSKIGSGSTPRGGKDSYKVEGISLIRSMNVHDFYFKFKELAFIDDSQAKKLTNVEVFENDILFNITGASVARCCLVPKEIIPARVNQHVAIIRLNQVGTNYLLCALCSVEYKRKLIGVGESGSTRQAITKNDLDSVKMLFPERSVLKKFERLTKALFNYKSNKRQEEKILKEQLTILLSKMTKVEVEKEIKN